MADRVALLLSNPVESLEDDEENAGLPQEYKDYLIMKTMGWDYWTFGNQPEHILFMIYSFILAENEAQLNRKGRNEQ